jgi:hypothetical protein
MKLILALLLLTALPISAADNAMDRLHQVRSLRCTITESRVKNFESGKWTSKLYTDATEFQIDNIDLARSTARYINQSF